MLRSTDYIRRYIKLSLTSEQLETEDKSIREFTILEDRINLKL